MDLAHVDYPWIPDQFDGSFRNPILFADYSDPDAIRHGDDFYMTASSFNCTPGLPILHSRDLVNWTLIGHAVENLPDPRFRQVQHGCGVWAPALRFHAGKFWIVFPMPDEGIFVVTADHPAGPWSSPHLLQAGKGLIDPCPLWDDDGQAYLVYAYAFSRAGINNRLRISPMAPDASRLLGEGPIVFHQPDRHPTVEGPKFLKKDGYYYILAPAGGVATGWQLVLRSRHIYGPYEEKIVLEQGPSPINGPHQGALVDLPNGDWWFLHFQELLPWGRIVHLQPVTWRDGWPLMGADTDANGVGEPALQWKKPAISHASTPAIPQTSDDFRGPRLGLQWQWHANHEDCWHTLLPGRLRLFAQCVPGGDFSQAPNLLLQKLPARAFTVDITLELSASDPRLLAGLIMMGRAHAALALRRLASNAAQLLLIIDNKIVETRDLPSLSAIRLQLAMDAQGRCRFAAALPDAPWQPFTPLFQAVEGKWIGAKVGLFCLTQESGPAGHADFGPFTFHPPATLS